MREKQQLCKSPLPSSFCLKAGHEFPRRVATLYQEGGTHSTKDEVSPLNALNRPYENASLPVVPPYHF